MPQKYGGNKADERNINVKYNGRDFATLRKNLIDFAKEYYPNTYNDFNEASPGMMFLESAAYVGDVMSFYTDLSFKESLLPFAEELETVYKIAQTYGYKPSLSYPSQAQLDVYVVIPANAEGNPDYDYAPRIKAGMQVTAQCGQTFRVPDPINFQASGSRSPIGVTMYEQDSSGLATKYLLQKQANAVSGEVVNETFTFESPKKYDKVTLQQNNILEIISCVDSDGNNWYEVPYLAQDTIFTEAPNTPEFDTETSVYASDVPYMLKLLKTSRRFTRYVNSNGTTEIRFGGGTANSPDEEIIPNPDSVGSSLPGGTSKLDIAFDPTNFLNTKTYGQAPANTTLTIRYSYGGGAEDNVRSNTIDAPTRVEYDDFPDGLDATKISNMKNTLVTSNKQPSTGGRSGESIDEIKKEAAAYFQAQGRAVTKEDYMTRIASLPTKYGNISKLYITKDSTLGGSEKQLGYDTKIDAQYLDDNFGGEITFGDLLTQKENPLALNFYTLGYDSNKYCIPTNEAVKQNIRTYLTQYRLMTDAVNIKDAYVINIGVRFQVLTLSNYNKHEVVLACIEEIKRFFQIDKWQINQPIIVGELSSIISKVPGVAAIVPIKSDGNPNNLPIVITNKYESSSGYSGNLYDINEATKGGVIYPSLDPAIFELKFPNTDIEGRVVGDIESATE